MTRLQSFRSILRLRHALYLIGVALMIGSLLGAKLLTGGHESDNKTDPSRANQEKLVGPVVMGTVDSDPQPIEYRGLPPVLQSGTIAKVLVKDGDKVSAGGKLYVFDTSSLVPIHKVAQKAVEVTRKKYAEAKLGLMQHAEHVKNLQMAVELAGINKDLKTKTYNFIKGKLVEGYKLNNASITQEEIDTRLNNEDKLFIANVDYIKALNDWKLQERELDTLKVAGEKIANLIEQADAVVKQAEEEVARAQTAIDLCTIYAKVDGTIEQVTIGEGTTLGISSIKPALLLIPAGPRIVRAEIEADFAHRVTTKLIDKEVTIYDNTNPKLTYKGKVLRISDTFLPKRSGNEGFLGTGTLVLEAAIKVIDAAPADLPPLRVGQRVRVDLGQ
jgi:multidrug resistance efflux pump